jgi:hypothetical protein
MRTSYAQCPAITRRDGEELLVGETEDAALSRAVVLDTTLLLRADGYLSLPEAGVVHIADQRRPVVHNR